MKKHVFEHIELQPTYLDFKLSDITGVHRMENRCC